MLLATAACSGGTAEHHGDASQHRAGSGADPANTAADLGAVPIPQAPAKQPVATAAPGKPTVLEMGAPVLVGFGHGTRALLTGLGPVQGTTRPGASSTKGTFTITVVPRSGRLTVGLRDFTSRNESGKLVHLTTVGPSSVTATTSRPAHFRFAGHYGSGAAQITYRHHGKFVAIWDFNIELD